ncbi:MAG: hypothetical protein MUO38_15020, partial [Anaerolineales bacterium]|nr:hypothetical protein [Anaerolineales bacterium]
MHDWHGEPRVVSGMLAAQRRTTQHPSSLEAFMSEAKAIVMLFTGNGMGSTEAQDLRQQLAIKFLRLLGESGSLPRVICFYTEGVKLVCD